MSNFIEIKSGTDGLHIINLNHVISIEFVSKGVDINMFDNKQIRLTNEDWEQIKNHFGNFGKSVYEERGVREA